MSGFFQCYYFHSSEQKDVYDLLTNANQHGFIFTPVNGWTQFTAEGISMRLNPSIVENSTGLLIHMLFTEDHGWEFQVFDRAKQMGKYSCRWDFGIHIDIEGDYDWLYNILGIGSESIKDMMFPNHQDAIKLSEEQPGEAFCRLIGLRSIDSIAYHYMKMYPQIYLDMDPGILEV